VKKYHLRKGVNGMSQFKVIGTVPPFIRNEFYLRVDNGKELEKFFRDEKIDTKLRDAEGKPLICVRGELTTYCKPGDHVRHTIEIQDRKNGFRGIKGINIEVLS
jgi:hypothetical protein